MLQDAYIVARIYITIGMRIGRDIAISLVRLDDMNK